MNEIKQGLIEVAGDLSDSKARLRNQLHQQQNRNKDFRRNVLAGISVVAMIALFFLATTILINQQKELAQTTTAIFNDQVFETAKKLNGSFDFYTSEEQINEISYEDYEKKLAFYTYAISLGYEMTDEEIQNSYQKTKQLYSTEEAKKSWQEMFTTNNISWEEYDEYVLKNSPYQVALEKLKQHFMQMYPKIDNTIARSLAEKHAIPYFHETYANEIIAFKKKHTLPLNNKQIYTGENRLGRVIAMEDNMILVVPNATIEDIDTLSTKEILHKYNDGAWYPQDEIPIVKVGDLVETYSKTTSTSENITLSDIWDLKIIDNNEPQQNDTILLTIPSENTVKVKSFVNMLRWETKTFEMSQTADYEFILDSTTYQLWSLEDGFLITTSKGMYRKLNDDFTEDLKNYLNLP